MYSIVLLQYSVRYYLIIVIISSKWWSRSDCDSDFSLVVLDIEGLNEAEPCGIYRLTTSIFS